MKLSNVLFTMMIGSSLVFSGCGGSTQPAASNDNSDGVEKQETSLSFPTKKGKKKSNGKMSMKNSSNVCSQDRCGGVDVNSVMNDTYSKCQQGDIYGAAEGFLSLSNYTSSFPAETNAYIAAMSVYLIDEVLYYVGKDYNFDPYDQNSTIDDVPKGALKILKQTYFPLMNMEAEIHSANRDDKKYQKMLSQIEQEWDYDQGYFAYYLDYSLGGNGGNGSCSNGNGNCSNSSCSNGGYGDDDYDDDDDDYDDDDDDDYDDD